jgi:hypothetical protein
MSVTLNQKNATVSKNKRSGVRFFSDPGTFALIDIKPKKKDFNPEFRALVVTESFKGCSLVIVNALLFVKGDKVKIKVGDLSPLVAEIRWSVELDDGIQKLGLMFLE